MQKSNFGILIIITIFLLGSISSTLTAINPGDCIDIKTVLNSSLVNISIAYPNLTDAVTQQAMTPNGFRFNYTFCNTITIGRYIYDYCDNVGNCYENDFYSGEEFGTPQALIILGQFGIICLFIAIGITFKQEKWKIRSFFFMAALLMGVILLNSIRMVIGTSTNLAVMGSIGLILGIVVLSFMFLYLLISYTIEVFSYFKEKSKMRWDISNPMK